MYNIYIYIHIHIHIHICVYIYVCVCVICVCVLDPTKLTQSEWSEPNDSKLGSNRHSKRVELISTWNQKVNRPKTVLTRFDSKLEITWTDLKFSWPNVDPNLKWPESNETQTNLYPNHSNPNKTELNPNQPESKFDPRQF